MSKQVPLDDVLNEYLFRIENLENMVHQLSEHMAAQNHLMHVLARQVHKIAIENDIDINQRYN
jgi:hypothetical protein